MPFAFVLSVIGCGVQPIKTKKQDSAVKQDMIHIKAEVKEQFSSAIKYLNAKQYEVAIPILEKIVKAENRVPAPFVNLAMAYDITGKAKLAEKYYLEALAIDLVNRVANNQLGLLYRKLGRFDDAKKAYTNALTRYPDYLPVIKNLGILCDLYMRDLSCALEQYQHYQALMPDDKTIKIWISDISRRLK